jgi:hypothetical protein
MTLGEFLNITQFIQVNKKKYSEYSAKQKHYYYYYGKMNMEMEMYHTYSRLDTF